MKIKYEEDNKLNHHEVRIIVHPTNKETIHLFIKSMKEALKELEVFDEYYNYYKISIMSIYYIEIIEHKIFVYTKESVYRRNDTIKELKDKLKKFGFFQVNVRTLINKYHVKCYKVGKDCRRILVLDNQEKIIVNRNYKEELRQNLKDKFEEA